MLYPKIELVTEHSFCSCGAPNFRNADDARRIYKLYSLEMPTHPYGSVKYVLCDECLRKIFNGLQINSEPPKIDIIWEAMVDTGNPDNDYLLRGFLIKRCDGYYISSSVDNFVKDKGDIAPAIGVWHKVHTDTIRKPECEGI